eukprot:7825543-Alexandrium_andersonii.AAC.1
MVKPAFAGFPKLCGAFGCSNRYAALDEEGALVAPPHRLGAGIGAPAIAGEQSGSEDRVRGLHQ